MTAGDHGEANRVREVEEETSGLIPRRVWTHGAESKRKQVVLIGMMALLVLTIVVLFSQSDEDGAKIASEGVGSGHKDDDDYDEATKQAHEEEQSYFVNEEDLLAVYSKDHKLVGPLQECHPNNTENVKKGTWEYELLSADCGLGYNYTNSTSRKRPWKVALYGAGFNHASQTLSGCPIGHGKCPFSPRCELFLTLERNEANAADVVVIFQKDAELVRHLSKRPNQYRVLYWREAYMKSAAIETQKRFHLEMGMHWTAGILNPQFMRTPAALLGGITYPRRQIIPFIAVEKRTNFAMSIISACGANSKRQIYIDRLVQYLGVRKVHQYGRCGNLELPPPPIKNAAKIIATYKFYLAFENSIEDAYCTEKLLQVLAMPILAVYYGTMNTPNITITPSFIKVSDFAHPKYLADYLLHLDQNPSEYNQYHAWRTNPKLFHPDYLRLLSMKSPGPYELLPLRSKSNMYYPRTAACCRLCDANYLEWAKNDRSHLIEERWSPSRIEKQFFQGKFFGPPKPLQTSFASSENNEAAAASTDDSSSDPEESPP